MVLLQNSLKWPLLKTRRDLRDLEMFYKIETGLMNMSFPQELAWGYSRTRGHQRKYRQIGGSVNAYKHSFFVRTVPMWNTLPAAAVQTDMIAAFKVATSTVV